MKINIKFIIITFKIELNSIWGVEISIIWRLFEVFKILSIAKREILSLSLFDK